MGAVERERVKPTVNLPGKLGFAESGRHGGLGFHDTIVAILVAPIICSIVRSQTVAPRLDLTTIPMIATVKVKKPNRIFANPARRAAAPVRIFRAVRSIRVRTESQPSNTSVSP